jgi:hypothetical protein
MTADARRFHRVPLFLPVAGSRVPISRAPKRFAFQGLSRISIMSGIGHCVDGIGPTAWRCVPLSRARGFHVANLQADADLHTLSIHHRDAVHDMRRADAARIDRTARPQLQSADLSLRALRFRRELFKDAVNRRHFDWTRFVREKALARTNQAEAQGVVISLFAGDLRGHRVKNPRP